MSEPSGQVPRGLVLTIALLTAVAVAVAVIAAIRGTWVVTVIAGLMAVVNLVLLRTVRAQRADTP